MQTPESYLIQNIDESRRIIRFFLSKALFPDYHEEIKKALLKESQKDVAQNRIKIGMFSSMDYARIEGAFNIRTMKITLENLERHFFISKQDFSEYGSSFYMINEKYTQALGSYGVIENILFGFQYSIKKYRNSVFKIENTDKNGDKDIGTGFLISINGILIIATNDHVVSNNHGLKLFTVQDKEVEFDLIYSNQSKDIAFLKIKRSQAELPKFINQFLPIPVSTLLEPLNEIITIGYPSIPFSKEAYQVYHKGEINSLIEDYGGNKLFIISAKTSSGNSGSPVIDRNGMVVGMITRELFDKGALEEKGKLPYYAVIPSLEILNCAEVLLKKT